MSRYTKNLEDGKTVAYGHDHVLGFFIDVFDIPDDEDEERLIVEQSSMFGASNSDILETMKSYGVNEDHRKMVALDLTF